jgi:ubiquinol-cytochrome c reductase iron-sulfur subunit
MTEQKKVDKTRRNLVVATSVVGGAASVGAAVPFVTSMWPSERAKAAGAPVEVDVSSIAPGEMKVLRRTERMLEAIRKSDPRLSDPKSEVNQQPAYAKNEFRSRKPELMVVVGVCTHLGCSPKEKGVEETAEMGADWLGGFYCPCHGSKFDFAGRVYKGSPAPTNLEVPKYEYLSESTLLIGEDKKGA